MLFHLPTLQLVLNYIKQISKNTRALYPGSILPFLLNMQIMFKWGSVYLLNLHHHINRSLLFGFWQTQHCLFSWDQIIINSMNLWGVYSFMFNFMFKEWNLQDRNVCGFFLIHRSSPDATTYSALVDLTPRLGMTECLYPSICNSVFRCMNVSDSAVKKACKCKMRGHSKCLFSNLTPHWFYWVLIW